MKLKMRIVIVGMFLSICVTGFVSAQGVKAWNAPNGSSFNRSKWKPITKGSAPASIALENDNFILVAKKGASGVMLTSKGKMKTPTQLELTIRTASGLSTFQKIEMKELDENTGTLRLTLKEGWVDLTVETMQSHVTVQGIKEGTFLEVKMTAVYAVLPDFFGYDLVYNPAQFKSERIVVPAENFVLNLVKGNEAMIMCVWPNAATPKATDNDPAVELCLTGTADVRRVSAVSIESMGRPIYVAIIEHENLWHEEDISSLPVLEPVEIKWQRSFDAKWRANILAKEGVKSANLMTRSQSYDFLYKPAGNLRKMYNIARKKGPEEKVRAGIVMKRWEKGYPRVAEEAVHRHIYPVWFDQEKTFLALYADDPELLKKKDKRAKAENIYEKVIFYPSDRTKDTPLSLTTPVDVMRNTLGKGPCEYVLDLEGIKSRRSSGQENRKLKDVATCTIWLQHIFPIVSSRKSKPITPEKKAYLIEAIQDMPVFVHAVRIRIEEYETWRQELSTWLDQLKPDAELKPAVDRIRILVDGMGAMIKKYDLEKFRSSGAEWDKKTSAIVVEVEGGDIKAGAKIGKIRPLAQLQDNAVSDCRRYAKAIRQEVSFVESNAKEVQKFVGDVRKKCRQILRHGHPKEMLHSDPRTEER